MSREGPDLPDTIHDGGPTMTKECPLCLEKMRLSVRETVDHVPGLGGAVHRVAREWVCPECDYFEEAEAGEGAED